MKHSGTEVCADLAIRRVTRLTMLLSRATQRLLQ